MDKSRDAFRTISEVADWLGVQPHVLRFWESKFSQVKPVKRAGGRRYYRPNDMLLLGGIRKLLHEDGLTIKGAQKILREDGMAHVAALSRPLEGEEDTNTPPPDPAPVVDTATEPDEAALAPPHAAAEDQNDLFDTAADATSSHAEQDDAPQDAPIETPAFSARTRETQDPDAEYEQQIDAEAELDADAAWSEADMSAAPHEEDAAAPPRPRVIDIPDPDEAALSVAPGPLSAAFRTNTLSTGARQDLAPLVGKLAALRDRLASERGTGPRG